MGKRVWQTPSPHFRARWSQDRRARLCFYHNFRFLFTAPSRSVATHGQFQISAFFVLKGSSHYGSMASKAESIGFKVWGADNVVYGPVELPELVTWVQGKRITGDPWGFSEKAARWRRAA